MTYKVSVLRGSKGKPELVQVAEVLADRFALSEEKSDRGAFMLNNYGIAFYVTREGWFGKEEMVAFFPGTDWVVQ